MPLPIALAIAAVKAGCLIAGSLIHEGVKFVTSLGADHKDIARGPYFLIEDQQLGQDTPNPKESPSPSNALILYGSREVVPSSSSREVTLPNDSSALGSQDDVTDIDLFSVMMNSFNFFAAWSWLFARFIALMHALLQSALRSVVSDMKMSFALFCGSVSDNAVQKKQVARIAFLIQVYFTRFMAKVFVILKEAVRLLKSTTEKKISTLLGPLFPAGNGGERSSALFTDCTSVGDSSLVDVGTLMQKYLAIITFVKQVLAIISDTSTSGLGRLTRLHTTKVMTFVLLLGASISLIIGWSIPPMVFNVSNLDQFLLLQPASEVEAGSFGSVTSPFTSLPVDTLHSLNLMESMDSFDDMSYVQVDSNHIDSSPSLHWPANDFSTASTFQLQTVMVGNKLDLCLLQQPIIFDAAEVLETGSFSSITPPVGTSTSLNLMEPIDTFDDMSSVSMKMGATDQLVDFPPSLYSPANDFSATSTPVLHTGWIYFVSRNIDASHYIQSLRGFESTLESLPLINVLELPSEDHHASNETATEHSGGYIVSAATANDANVTRSISQAPHQSFVELETSPSSSASDGDTSVKPMIIIVVGPPQEVININYLGEFDGFSHSMQVNSRNSSVAVQIYEILADLGHPVLIAYNRGSILFVWSENDFIIALSSPSLSSFIWNHDAAAITLLEGNIRANHSILSEPNLFYASGDLSLDRYDANPLPVTSDLPALGLGRSLPSNTDTSSMQMKTTELEPSQELPTIQNRQFGRSPIQNATIYPQLMLPAPSDGTNSFEKIGASVLMNHSRRSSSQHSSLRFSTHKERHIFVELRQLALLLLMLAYHDSDGTANEPDDVALSCGPMASLDTDLEIDEESDAEIISTDGENEEDFVLPGDTNTIKSSRRELKALHSDLGSHWNSPSKRRMRRSTRTRSRPQYFQPT